MRRYLDLPVWLPVALLVGGVWACNSPNSGSSANPDGGDAGNDAASDVHDPFADDAGETDLGLPLDPDSVMGPGTGKAYLPTDQNSSGVTTNADGALVLSSELAAQWNNLWVANANEHTVSNVDTKNLVEAGRYYSGLANGADPSRTSVDLAGDVFVGNRGDGSVTKIAGNIERCVERNGIAGIQTSTGATPLPRSTDVASGFPVGQSTDECVLWTKDLATAELGCSGTRGVAATAETGTNFQYNGHVWIGCRNSGTIYKLNGATGDVTAAYGPFDGTDGKLNVRPYGFVLDKQEQNRLWISGRGGGGVDAVYWMDTRDGTMHQAVDVVDGDAPKPYGIALDDNSHVWIATLEDGWIWRYRPEDQVWEGRDVTTKFKGIAVDVDGFVWAIDNDAAAEIYLVDPATFPAAAAYGPFPLADATNHPLNGGGVAIDFSGQVWGVSEKGCPTGAAAGCATRLTVDRGGAVPAVGSTVDNVQVGVGTYSYSDMIGYSLRNFTTKEGWYRQVFEVCDPTETTRWDRIAFQSNTPVGTRFVLRARTADRVADLASAPWFTVVQVPSDTSPRDLPADLPEGHFIELEVRLYTLTTGVTPIVGEIGFTFDCTGTITLG